MPRTGTTYLYFALQKTKKFFVPLRKEIDFFAIWEHALGNKWYKNLYRQARPHQITLDISPLYFMHPSSAEQIKKALPDTKVILILRDIEDWKKSLYQQISSFTLKMPDFEDFKKGYHLKMGDIDMKFDLSEAFVQKQVDLYKKEFSENLLIISYLSFQQNLEVLVKNIADFCSAPLEGVQCDFENIVVNAKGRRGSRLINALVAYITHKRAFLKYIPLNLLRVPLTLLRNLTIAKNSTSAPVSNRPDALQHKSEWLNALFEQSHFIRGDGVPLYK